MANYHPRGKLVHGFMARKHPLYSTWANMKVRCYDTENKNYPKYGGRGITVCQQWLDSFETFATDMGLPPTSQHTLDRKNNELGYSSENCRWATGTEQCLNRRLFSNNASGETGIHKAKNGSFICKYDEEGHRYNLGRFPTLESAIEYRNRFLELFICDKEAALKMTERRARLDSATGIKGIEKNAKGYVVRVTLLDGKRKYLGFSKTLEGAKEKLQNFIDAGGVFK